MLKTTLVINKMLYLVKILTGFAEKQKLVPKNPLIPLSMLLS